MTAALFDSHCHLDADRFDDDREQVLARARDAGVARIVTVGAGRGTSSAGAAIGLAAAHPGWIYATVGVHPHDARLANDDALALCERLAGDAHVVAIGETGLDFHYDLSPRDAQMRAFRDFVGLALRAGKPLVVHTRSAPEQTLRILREERADRVGGIIHCFSEDAAFAEAAWRLGFASSFSGMVTFPKARAIVEAARQQPLEAILIETDAPFLAPVPRRGRRNEPAYVGHTAAAIAAARGIPTDALIAATTRNACRVYRIPEPE